MSLLSPLRRVPIRAWRHRLARRLLPPVDPLQPALDLLLAKGVGTADAGPDADPVTVVQIGSYIGGSGTDPLFHRLQPALREGRVRLLCVEPVRSHFEALVRNYEGIPGVTFEQAAIAHYSGPGKLYRIDVEPREHGLPDWFQELGSLKKERMESLWDGYEAATCPPQWRDLYLKHRVEEPVPCLTPSDLFEKHGIRRTDLLLMDTEGFEWEILSCLPFDQVPVRFLHFEHVLLGERRGMTRRHLQAQGYTCLVHDQNTFCHLRADRAYRDRDPALSRRARWITWGHRLLGTA